VPGEFLDRCHLDRRLGLVATTERGSSMRNSPESCSRPSNARGHAACARSHRAPSARGRGYGRACTFMRHLGLARHCGSTLSTVSSVRARTNRPKCNSCMAGLGP
jgi:hypothetical protein